MATQARFITVVGLIIDFKKGDPVKVGTAPLRGGTVPCARFSIKNYKNDKVVQITVAGDAYDVHGHRLEAGCLIYANGSYTSKPKSQVQPGGDPLFHSVLITDPSDIWIGDVAPIDPLAGAVDVTATATPADADGTDGEGGDGF